MAYIFFWLSFGYSFNHVILTLIPSDQLFNQLRLYNCNLIDKFSMICFRDHHSKFVAKILHLIFLINNGQNCSNFIDICEPYRHNHVR